MTLDEFYKQCDAIIPDKRGCKIWKELQEHPVVRISDRGNKQFSPTRLALERKLGRPITPGLGALHSCDNRWCVEMSHLREGTALENYEDMVVRNPEAVRLQKTLGGGAFWEKMDNDPEFRKRMIEARSRGGRKRHGLPPKESK